VKLFVVHASSYMQLSVNSGGSTMFFSGGPDFHL